MAITVPRPNLKWSERIYLPAILSGMAITFRHLKNMLTGRTKVVMQYPEQKWDSQLPDHYRGAPALVRDEAGRVRCVASQPQTPVSGCRKDHSLWTGSVHADLLRKLEGEGSQIFCRH